MTNEHWFAASKPPVQSPQPAASGGAQTALASVPVLVIEDEAMIAWMLESLLEDMGFEMIALASNAKEAAAAVERRTPKLVISDINLGPGADGVQAVQSICGLCSPAVVFVSAYIDESTRRRIAEQVADARILSKPVSGDGLSAIIKHALKLDRPN